MNDISLDFLEDESLPNPFCPQNEIVRRYVTGDELYQAILPAGGMKIYLFTLLIYC
jgi:hypothetical protein